MSTARVDPNFDPARAEAFASRFLTALNSGALCLMVSVGHRTGLFDVMIKLPPATSEEIAAAAGLNERYVREWLGAMVTGGIVARSVQQTFLVASGTWSVPGSSGGGR